MCKSLFLRLAILLFIGSTSAGPSDTTGVNIALRKPVYAEAKWHGSLVDGNLGSPISPVKSNFPAIVVDLLDVYNLSSVHLHAQNHPNFGNAGLNVKFSLYAWDKPTSKCDFQGSYPWNPVARNLTFKKKGEKIVVDVQIEAQYLIILIDVEDFLTPREGLTIGELQAFGVKTRDGLNGKMPDDGTPLTNIHMETRKQLLKGQSKIYGEFSYMQYMLNSNYTDVALAWRYDRVCMMTAVREKARMILMTSLKGLEMLVSDSGYTALKNNLAHWLNPNNPNAKFVKVSQDYKEGDILLITQKETFDIDAVYKSLHEGTNSAIIAYMREKTTIEEDAVSRLMTKLEVLFKPVDYTFKIKDLPVSDFINNQRDVPTDFDLKVSLQSWYQFRTTKFRYYFPEEELKTDRIQNQIREILLKYHDYFTYHAICRTNPYKRNPDTHNAFLNYNNLLMMQRGDKAIVAPGVWNTPGGVDPSLKPTNYTVQLNVEFEGRYYPMGAYAKPGEAFYFKILNHSHHDIRDHRIRVGMMMDEVAYLDWIGRWPFVTRVHDIFEPEGKIVTPFGGPIVLWLPGNSKTTIYFENVYRYPWFDVRNPKSVEAWDEQRKKYRGVPFGMIMGDDMISILEMPAILRMNKETILWATTYYDNVIKMCHNFRGTRFEGVTRQVFNTDDQLAAGFGHSGYPWVGYRSWANLYGDLAFIKKGGNHLYPHEIGHNLQVPQITYFNGKEVSNIIYTPVVHKYLLGLNSFGKGAYPGGTDGDERGMINGWKSGRYNGIGVSYYVYVGRLFGPGVLGNLLSKARQHGLGSDDHKANFWIKNMCIETNHDVVPFHRLWHFNINKDTINTCSQFECFFPDDELTKQAQGVVDKILKEYGKDCKRNNPNQVEFKADIMRGINTTRPQDIFFPFE